MFISRVGYIRFYNGMNLVDFHNRSGDPGEVRTHGHLIKSQVLYQLSYRIMISILTTKIIIVKHHSSNYNKLSDMVNIKSIFFSVLILTTIIFGNVKFNSDSIEITFPDVIIASGNANFHNDGVHISADQFSYNTTNLNGSFKKNVVIKYKNSKLNGDELFVNLKDKIITGNGNIRLKTKGFEATSDLLTVSDYKLAHLKNNVEIKRNGSQINSNGLVYNLETDTILSTERVKLKVR